MPLLCAFTITELLESVGTKSREFEHELMGIVRSSYKDRDAGKHFQYTGAFLVHNTQLQNAVSLPELLSTEGFDTCCI